MPDQLQDLRAITATQCSDGNWNYDPYLHGMANGMILSLALMEGKEPQFLSAPARWLADVSLFAQIRRRVRRWKSKL